LSFKINYMKLKVVLTLFVMYSSLCQGQIKNLEKLNITLTNEFKLADSLILFKFNSDNLCNQSKAVSIIKKNEISGCFDYVRTIKADKVDTIIKLLHDKTTYGGGNVACFDTDYAIIAIKNSNIIAYVNISLSCNKLIANPKIQEQEAHYKNEGVGRIGFSRNGKEKLIHLLGID